MSTPHVLAPKLPGKMTDLIVLLNAIDMRWSATPGFSIMSLTLAQFQAAKGPLITTFNARVNDGLNRPDLTQQMKNGDEKVLEGTPELKSYIATNWGTKNAESHYPQFGMVHRMGRGWEIPRDHSQRLFGLTLLVSSLGASPFGGNPYGTAYWLPILAAYQSAFNAAYTEDGLVGSEVAQIKEARGIAEDMAKNIYYGIVANYWTTFTGEARNWGFQQEDY